MISQHNNQFSVNGDRLFDVHCKSYSVSEFNSAFSGNLSDIFSISHVNVRSLSKNYDDFQLLFENSLQAQFKIIAVSEIWKVENKSIFTLPNYSFEVNCRDVGRGGGVGMYVHDSLHYNILNDIVITDAESLWIEVINRNNKFIIGTIYRPPSSNSDIFIDSLEQILYHRVQGYAGCFLVGDFNIDVSKPCEATADKLLSVLSCLHFEQTIITPTRITGASETTIDHLYTNMAHLNITSGTLLAHISDHLPTFAFFHSMTMHSASKANGPFRNC